MMTRSGFSHFSRLSATTLFCAFALAACAVEGQDPLDPAAGEEIATRSDALINNGGGPRNGFSCDRTQGVCECNKSIEGDCDDMRKNCTGGLEDLDKCISGWLTTHCTCTYSKRILPSLPPIYTAPGGGVLAPSP